VAGIGGAHYPLIESRLQQLLHTGQVVIADPQVERSRNMESLNRLRQRFDSTNARTRFLAYYDATFRLIEVVLNNHGYRLAQQPHRTVRELYLLLYPDSNFTTDELRTLVHTRHRIKKENETPTKSELLQVLKFFELAQKK
jgi:transcriptional regulator NrdR family protein